MPVTEATSHLDHRLVRVFQEVFRDPDLQLRPDLAMSDLPGWDSLRMVTLLLALERDCGVRFRSGAVRRIGSVGDIMRLLEAHGV